MRAHFFIATTICLTWAPSPAQAYDEEVHVFLVRAALKGSAIDVPEPPAFDPEGPAAVRRAIDAWARTSSDAAIRGEWIRRFPNPESFDAWAFKELLLLSPAATVLGIDELPRSQPSFLELLADGARAPDVDFRNLDRFAYDAGRRKVLDSLNRDVPADPAILNMGRLGKLSSQAHAHYGLPDIPLSDDPEVLKTDPRRFALPTGYPKGPVLALAREMAQAHLDLALVAASLDTPSPALSWLCTAHAFHYLQDVSNQVHTVQVGIYDFFVDATVQRLIMSLKTGGGYFSPLRTMGSIGVDILTNHHVLSEQLTKKRLMEAIEGEGSPEGEGLVGAPVTDDPILSAAFDAALTSAKGEPWEIPFGEILTGALIELSSHEGGKVYALMTDITQPRFRKEGVIFDEKKDDPDACILPSGKRDEKAYSELFELQSRAFRRAGTAMRRWIALKQQALAAAARGDDQRNMIRSAAIERLVRRQLRMLGEAEARRADYLTDPPEESKPDRMPGVLAAEIIVPFGLALVAARLASRSRRRASGQ